MERMFNTAKEFEEFFSGGLEIEPWMRKNQEAKQIIERRMHVWMAENGVPEAYEPMVLAIEDYYNYLAGKKDRDEYEEWALTTWYEALSNAEERTLFCYEDEDASD